MYWRLTPSTYPKVNTKAPDRLPGPSPLGWFNAHQMGYIDSEPPHVAIIFEATLRIKASTPEIETALSQAGYRAEPDEHGLTVEFERDTFLDLLRCLSTLRVAFSLDQRQAMSPAARVAALIETGTEIDTPTACSFDGERWLLHDYPWEQRFNAL